MSAHRAERMAAAIERGVRDVLVRGLADERIRGLITVTGVKVSPDFRDAAISISVLPAEHGELTLHGLSSAAPHIRRQVCDLVQSRDLPALRFVLDLSLKREAAVLRDIDRAAADLAERAKKFPPAEESPAGETPA